MIMYSICCVQSRLQILFHVAFVRTLEIKTLGLSEAGTSAGSPNGVTIRQMVRSSASILLSTWKMTLEAAFVI